MSGTLPPPLPGESEPNPPSGTPGPVAASHPAVGPPPLPTDHAAVAPPPLPGQEASGGASADPMPSPPRLPDPGPLRDPAILHTTEDTRTYPCPSCGGMLGFDPDVQGLKCLHCATVVTLPDALMQPSVVVKHDLRATMDSLARVMEEHPTSLEREVVCQSCGGHTLFTGSFTATRCPYCNTPIQRDDVQAARTRLAIDGILPFQVSEKRAREEMNNGSTGGGSLPMSSRNTANSAASPASTWRTSPTTPKPPRATEGCGGSTAM